MPAIPTTILSPVDVNLLLELCKESALEMSKPPPLPETRTLQTREFVLAQREVTSLAEMTSVRPQIGSLLAPNSLDAQVRLLNFRRLITEDIIECQAGPTYPAGYNARIHGCGSADGTADDASVLRCLPGAVIAGTSPVQIDETVAGSRVCDCGPGEFVGGKGKQVATLLTGEVFLGCSRK